MKKFVCASLLTFLMVTSVFNIFAQQRRTRRNQNLKTKSLALQTTPKEFVCKVKSSGKGRNYRPFFEVQGLDATTEQTGDVIDLLVLYTSKAREWMGGRTFIENSIDMAHNGTNEALRNSGINLTLRLVSKEEIDFAETENMDDLEDLKGGQKGEAARRRRDELKADLVVLVRYGGNMGGQAYALQSPLDDTDKTRAFAQVRADHITYIYGFAHEVAHLLGCAHDPDNLDYYGYSRTYSFGHFFNTPRFGAVGDIMSYRNYQRRILFYSNPDVSFDGVPTGTTTRNNARSINETRKHVANYR